MPARRCSICALNWPTDTTYSRCPVCDETTDYMNNVDNMGEVEAQRITTDPIGHQIENLPVDPVIAHRVERYLALGFTEVDAHVLAHAKVADVDSKGRTWTLPLNHLHVAKQLTAGATHEKLVRCYA